MILQPFQLSYSSVQTVHSLISTVLYIIMYESYDKRDIMYIRGKVEQIKKKLSL